MKKIPLGKGYYAIVSDEDYDFLTQWSWGWKTSARKYGGAVYAKRSTTVSGRNVSIYMAHVVLERAGYKKPSERHEADHGPGGTLDNRRENLQWLTRRQNRKKLSPARVAYYERVASA